MHQFYQGMAYSCILTSYQALLKARYGSPPNSHSAHMYGDGRTITNKPKLAASAMKLPTSAIPRNRIDLPRFMKIQGIYVSTVLHPQAFSFDNLSSQYCGTTR